jgi:hypothetical protein
VASGWKDALVADELEGVIDVVMSIQREPTVGMFHNYQAGEEAIAFVSWAYKCLHDGDLLQGLGDTPHPRVLHVPVPS